MPPYALILCGTAFFVASVLLGLYLARRDAAQMRAHRLDALGPGNEDLVDLGLGALWAAVLRLRKALRAHRDGRGPDRVGPDDIQLYHALPEPLDEALLEAADYHQYVLRCVNSEPEGALPVLPDLSLLPGIDQIPARDLRAIGRHTGIELLRFEAGRSDAMACTGPHDHGAAYMEGYCQGVRER